MNLTEQDRKDHDRAVLAKQVTENPLVLEAIAKMEADIYELWRESSLSTEQREELHRMQQTMDRFVGLFDLYLQNGAQARHLLGLPVEEKTFYQRIKEYFNGNTKT